jgi:hypothetical protein
MVGNRLQNCEFNRNAWIDERPKKKRTFEIDKRYCVVAVFLNLQFEFVMNKSNDVELDTYFKDDVRCIARPNDVLNDGLPLSLREREREREMMDTV